MDEGATMHKFKTNLARYSRLLESVTIRAVIVKRGDVPVGLFTAYPKDMK
jgi:hypothetical protein